MQITTDRSDADSGREVAPQARLDLHEEISDAGTRGCPRWPEHMRLLSSQGELVRGRCASTNLCDYCAKLAAVENSELLALDAMCNSAPEVWAVLTTPRSDIDAAPFYEARRQVFRALKRRWPACEYAALVEFTTGRFNRGVRLPHWNLMLKGIPAAEVDEAREVIVRVWCGRPEVRARPEAQHVDTVGEMGGLMRYLALHFQKESQKPPEGWRGHRFTKSRGYLGVATPEARRAARDSLAFKRELWRAGCRGLDGLDREFAARDAMRLRGETSWALCDITKSMLGKSRRVAFVQPQRARAWQLYGPLRPGQRRRQVYVSRPGYLTRRMAGPQVQEWLDLKLASRCADNLSPNGGWPVRSTPVGRLKCPRHPAIPVTGPTGGASTSSNGEGTPALPLFGQAPDIVWRA